jgi:hypothetical protein
MQQRRLRNLRTPLRTPAAAGPAGFSISTHASLALTQPSFTIGSSAASRKPKAW